MSDLRESEDSLFLFWGFMATATLAKIIDELKATIRVDTRAMAAFRIAFGLVVLFDFLSKSTGLTAFYTDQGILPRALAIENLGWWSFSFHMASGAFWFQSILMGAGCLLAISLILGYQTRLVTVALWLFVVSLQNRNHLILHSGDALLRLLLFWSIFLPMAEKWSLDSLTAAKTQAKHSLVAKLAGLAILMQMFSIYFFTAILKNHAEWNQNFTALYYVLSLEQYTTSIGTYMLGFPGLMKLLTGFTYYLELIGPILLFVPYVQRFSRTLIPALFIGFHLSLVLTMNLGLFPFVCIAGWILFLPPRIWDLVTFKFKGIERQARRALKHLPDPYHGRTPAWAQVVASVVLVFSGVSVITWNIMTLPAFDRGVPSFIRSLALPMRLDQYWCMFAPYPMRADGWFVVEGTLRDGTSMDTWNGVSPVSFEKPASLWPGFRNTQWRKYLGNVWIEKNENDLQLAFGKYVCREWNRLSGKREDGKKLEKYELFYMREDTPPPGEVGTIKQVFKWEHECFATPDKNPNSTPPVIKN